MKVYQVKIFFLILLAASLLCQCSSKDDSLPDVVDFNYHIRPILSQNCFTCHGPDPSSRKGDLRLDTYEGASKRLGNGNRAIVPGRPGKGTLMNRIQTDDVETIMPPPESKKVLSDYQIALIEKWISQGAKWKKHWAFIPPEADMNKDIDAFIDSEINRLNLIKSVEADESTLIRRISYVLTGLPPTIEEIEALREIDYEEVVDYYLDSKHFGEHWARHWMDLVRYAEGMGHEFDYTIGGAYHYRDYLIRAFNKDLPYDQLVKEHLAGDLLDSPRIDQEGGINESLIGTAYAFLGEGKHSPVDIKKEESDRIDNLIDVTSKSFQGLTVSCAKCHDHKFDPIPTTDYYAMYGMFESSRITPIQFKSQEKSNQLEELRILQKEAETRIKTYYDSIVGSPKSEKFHILGDFKNQSFEDWTSTGNAFGEKPLFDLYASSQSNGSGKIGTLRSPNFILQDSFVYIYARGKGANVRVIVDNFQLIQNPLYGNLMTRIESKDWQLYKMNVSNLKGHKAYIEVLPGEYKKHEYRIRKGDFVEVQKVFASDKSIEDLEIYRRTHIVEDTSRLAYKLDSIGRINFDSTFIMALSDGEAVHSPVFIRGDHMQLDTNQVPHGFLSILGDENDEYPQEGSGRLKWAEMVVDDENPLTARVMANRIWHHLFGRGIVESVDNFGLQGSLPSHPELLDYLSLKFVNNEWSIKSLIKEILLSQTFRRASTIDKANETSDPQNLYLASFPIRRLQAESIRDGILRVAGTLNDEMYGPSVPTHLTEFMNGRGRPSISGPLDGYARRSVYISIKRNFLSPMMLTFDRPIPFSTFGKRNITNVPAQSLFLMNDPFVHDQAGKLADFILNIEGKTVDEKLNLLFKRAYGREASSQEIAEAKKILEDFSENDQREVWKNYCHLIFNTKEFIHLF